MSHFKLWAQGVDVSRVNAELAARPDLWDAYCKRGKNDSASPHEGISDIWLRYRPEKELRQPADYHAPHFPAFWPAWAEVPSLHPLVRNMSHMVDAVHLGGIFVTRIRPGCQVKAHTDPGWHAQWFNRKLYLCLAGNPLSLNWVEHEPFGPRAGDVFEFDNQKTHRVTNDGTTDRVTAIICFRCEGL